MVQRVCLVSGGTGGHLLPALVLARALRERGHEPLLVTEGREVEREILRRELPLVTEVSLPVAHGSRLGLPWWLARATVAARHLLQEQGVDSVISTGGRPSVPVGFAARSLGVPLFLLEQNAVTGRANRLLAPFARRIYHGLPAAAARGPRSLVTGTPLRPEFRRIDRRLCREVLGLEANVPVVLVTGGSQGAHVLNEVVPAALVAVARNLQVLHLSGIGRDEPVRRLYASGEGKVCARVRPIAIDMDRMFGAADLVVCRGGGTTVAELAASGRPAVIVPYPHHRDQQQLRNAEILARVGAAIVVEEAALTRDGLADLLAGLLADGPRLEAMGRAAAALRPVDPIRTILGDMGVDRGGVDGRGADEGARGGAAVAAVDPAQGAGGAR
ncbi:MAG TPA: UDP-N-acetylglucosamine--N-acetylmuramyl-(pentapeptide) pyrophosphoryl-undecaprenol N-acetylglucosamine transferase [Planctomycetota bacterium]|nr:UDP-N-acetylglucosamine--N-acetylmuramyl-(pentapeptide) pyrophosphoryl-undecaprenol N-acetylglucosamine transferase [Planctomycetota bacterium]